MKTTPKDIARNYIMNVHVDLNVGSPLAIRIDFSLGPYYAIGDKIRLVDLDVTAGHVIGTVIDVQKKDNGVFAYVKWREEEMISWSPQEF